MSTVGSGIATGTADVKTDTAKIAYGKSWQHLQITSLTMTNSQQVIAKTTTALKYIILIVKIVWLALCAG